MWRLVIQSVSFDTTWEGAVRYIDEGYSKIQQCLKSLGWSHTVEHAMGHPLPPLGRC